MSQSGKLIIVYDGECPFCTAYIRLLRLKKSFDEVVLINAREKSAYKEEILLLGLDLDEGMVVHLDGRWMHGDEAIHFLSLASTENGFWNRLMAVVFRSPVRSKFLYPFLRCGRNIALHLLGRKKIGA